jgi:hypothetical protein
MCSAITISNSHYKNRFFESQPTAGFQKTDFGVSNAFGAGNTKIGFIILLSPKTKYAALRRVFKC